MTHDLEESGEPMLASALGGQMDRPSVSQTRLRALFTQTSDKAVSAQLVKATENGS